jgi:bifunctional DNA-binding transcriptional regulator/antitoxin component of YhaV-PrlF toxin-antitoxin module
LPAAARRAVGLAAGSRVTIETRGAEIVVRPVRDFFALSGSLGRALPRGRERAAAARGARRLCAWRPAGPRA